jgi:glycosyltransferase involved in cell wall biosynthesis
VAPSVTVISASGPDPYPELNDAADGAAGEWLLVPGADAPAESELITALLGAPVDDGCAAVISPSFDLTTPISAMAVRATAFRSVGGFSEGIALGGDADLCIRLAEAGWTVERRDTPAPTRAGRGRTPPRMAFAAGAASRWLERRARRGEAAEALVPAYRAPRGLMFRVGRIAGSNRSTGIHGSRAGGIVVWTDAYPARSETFVFNEVDALTRLGERVRVEALARPARSERAALRQRRIDYLEDDSPLVGAFALARLAARHPLRCLADRRAQARWRHEEAPLPLRSIAPAALRLHRNRDRHVHVHFMAGAALTAMRACTIAGVPYSAVGHGYDVFQRPRNLREKMAHASFVVAPCKYTARHLARHAPGGTRVEVIVMGVDPEVFRRASVHPETRRAIAIGRLVEKKGFRYLVEAVAKLRREHRPERVLIVGDGPLREDLELLARDLGVDDVVELVDAWGAGAIRALLEQAAILVMPAVIAADGDRDAMPVVVKEAMAMEIPVVASDEVGLPELVRPEWGRLVSPGDPDRLALAIREMLDLSVEERAAMGGRARAHVVERCSVELQARRLLELIGSE